MVGPQTEPAPPWRGWHVIGRFLPMVVLGFVFILIGASSVAPHHGAEDYGIIFTWIGVVLVACAVIGMLFTKCPSCYATHWVICFREPDVVHTPGEEDGYYRELSTPDEDG